MCNGVAGLLEERVVDLSTVLTDDLDIELLKRTPSSFLGSCRYKLPTGMRTRPSTKSCLPFWKS